MLHSLYIKNFAIIDEISVNFEDGLNIITGETGAGKSLIITGRAFYRRSSAYGDRSIGH